MKFIRALTPAIFVAALGGAVTLAPDAMADPPDVCSLLAAGKGFMDVVFTLQPYYPNVDTYYVEKFVDATERKQCPQYVINGPGYPSGGDGLYPGSGPIVNGQGGWGSGSPSSLGPGQSSDPPGQGGFMGGGPIIDSSQLPSQMGPDGSANGGDWGRGLPACYPPYC